MASSTSYEGTTGDLSLVFSIKYTGTDSIWQFRSLTRPRHQLSPPLANRERFDIRRPRDRRRSPHWAARMANASWLELLRLFAAVKHLYLSEGVALCLAPTLKGLTGGSGVTEVTVLPALQKIFVERFQRSGPVQEAIGAFVAARRLSGHPVDVQCWVNNQSTCQEVDDGFQ